MGKVIRVGILSPVRSLDPREARETVSSTACAQIYETACRAPRGDLRPEPLLLEGLAAQGPLRWTATVRPGVTFSDGTPLTAEIAASCLGRAGLVRSQARVAASGDRLEFHLTAPNPRFDLALTQHQAALVLEKGGRLLGTHAFMPAPGGSLGELRLVRNPRYRGRTAIDEIVFAVYPPDPDGRPQALIDALGRGEVDFTTMLSRTDASAVQGMRKLFQAANSTALLFFNTERPALAAPAVRRGLALAVDRMAVAEVSYANALAFVASGLLPPMMGAFRDEIEHDRARAEAALAALPRPARLELLTVWSPRPYLPNPRPVAELIARQLQAVGVEVKLTVPASSDEFYQACMRGDYDLLVGGWIGDTADPADFLEAVLRSDRVQTQLSSSVPCANRSRFRSPEMDAALAAFRQDPGPERREAVRSLVARQVPLLPLMYGPSVALSSWKLTGVEVSPLGIPQFAEADLQA